MVMDVSFAENNLNCTQRASTDKGKQQKLLSCANQSTRQSLLELSNIFYQNYSDTGRIKLYSGVMVLAECVLHD